MSNEYFDRMEPKPPTWAVKTLDGKHLETEDLNAAASDIVAMIGPDRLTASEIVTRLLMRGATITKDGTRRIENLLRRIASESILECRRRFSLTEPMEDEFYLSRTVRMRVGLQVSPLDRVAFSMARLVMPRAWDRVMHGPYFT